MKKLIRLLSAMTALTAAAALAQDTTPASATAAPSSQSAKPQKTKATSVKKRVEINPPASALVKGKAVNVRGQPSFVGEVLGHLQNGATVTIVEEITLSHPPSGEPAEWYKIAMPPGIPVWIKGDFIDASTKSVKVRRVNLRGGPGENYSVVGRLEKGAMVNELRDENGWAAIEAPSNAFAYVAAELLEIQAASAPVVAAAPSTEPATVNSPPVAVAAPATPGPAPAAPVAPAPTAQSESEQELAALRQAVATEPSPAAAVAAPASEPAAPQPTEPRVVTREGFVHKAYNIQSPADYELHDIKSGALIEYLQPQGQPNFKIYVGTRVTVTGSEVIDQRWPRTPILRVQSVDLMP